MNREQRRKQQRQQQPIQSIPFNQIIPPHQMTPDQCRQVILFRIQTNLEETKHPFHHKTVDGTIVDADPTLEYLINRLTDAPKAIPVNREHYGFSLDQIPLFDV